MLLTLKIVVAVVIAIAWAAVNAAYLVWAERRGAGIIQRRPGPNINGIFGLLQPPLDGIKLMAKQMFMPDGVDKILFAAAPVMVMTPAIVSFVTIPYSDWLQAQNIHVGLLMVFAFASLGTMGAVFAGWSSRNKYALMAAMRSVSQSVAYEIPMMITALTIVLLAGTTDLNAIVAQQSENFFHWNIFPLLGESHNLLMPLSFLIFFTCSLAETNRAPFDLGEAEGELVAGFHIEYGSMGFGLFFMGEYANIVIGSSLTTIFFLGGWADPFGVCPGVWWFLLKLYALICTIIWIRWTFPRTTIYGLLNLSWKILIPASLVNLLLTAGLLKVF